MHNFIRLTTFAPAKDDINFVTIMNTNTYSPYTPPRCEIAEVVTESGFLLTGDSSTEGLNNSGFNWGDDRSSASTASTFE